MLTDFHSKYFAAELTKRSPSDSAEKLDGVFVDAQVDLNPHQVEAALFAFRAPLSMGALLADEVGLGKTIEAGLVLSQKWAERKRKILAITPSNLRKQWHQELQEKFFIPCEILETRSYNQQVKDGIDVPFTHGDSIKICSNQFARNKAEDVRQVPWDLVVIDEAGDYDWAHLAYTIWPERVKKVCETDRSIAIAHNLEHLCKVDAPKPKKGRKGKKTQVDDEMTEHEENE